jgi:Ca-activated chloride channel family protein
MTFATPPVLIALVAIPLLTSWYVGRQRRRAQAAAAFVAPKLIASVAPHRPGWRRHLPMLAVALALAVLVIAAARPQTTNAVPVTDAAVMLANDVSASMGSTDVAPSRLGAAQRAAAQFLANVPSSIRVGLLEFNTKATLLQSPTTDHALTRDALRQLHAYGHTDIGVALRTAVKLLNEQKAVGGKRPPSAIILLSDGYSTNGPDPLVAAREAAQQHIPIYTVAVGTSRNSIQVRRGGKIVTVAVPPVSPGQLAQIAQVAGGRAYTASDAAGLKAVYAQLAAQIGHKRVKHEITASFAGGGLVLLLLASAMSLGWFGRLV